VIGKFMHPRVPTRLLNVIAGGRLDLTAVPLKSYPLGAVEAAKDAAARGGSLVVVEP
jgi:hypothetical protein